MQTRFAFGRNWLNYSRTIDERTVQRAEASLAALLGTESLTGRRFLDAGCGSGLFSLAARRLGAEVVSFDLDPDSLACTLAVKQRFRLDDAGWTVVKGSLLDGAWLDSLGEFDIVYCWGVAHHTGAQWDALSHLLRRVRSDGQIALAIYNDQGRASHMWTRVKRLYNRLPEILRPALVSLAFVRLWGPTLVRDQLGGSPLRTWRRYAEERGMSPWHDVIDWVGGWPFEVAKPEEVFAFCRDRGFRLEQLKTCAGGLGCNEFVFRSCGSAS